MKKLTTILLVIWAITLSVAQYNLNKAIKQHTAILATVDHDISVLAISNNKNVDAIRDLYLKVDKTPPPYITEPFWNDDNERRDKDLANNEHQKPSEDSNSDR